MNDELEKKLLDFNKQMMQYRYTFGQVLDPLVPQQSPNNFVSMDFTTNPPQEVSNQVIDVNPDTVEVSAEVTPEDTKEQPLKIPRGPRGKRGKRGPRGLQGPAGVSGKTLLNTKLVTTSYSVELEDDFIAVNCLDFITITLPKDAPNGKVLTFKLMMGAPLENRKVAIRNVTAGMIDSSFYFEMRHPYESLTIVYHGGDWCVLSNFKS